MCYGKESHSRKSIIVYFKTRSGNITLSKTVAEPAMASGAFEIHVLRTKNLSDAENINR